VPDPPTLFRAGLLEREVVAVLARGPLGAAAAGACEELRARVVRLGDELDVLDEEAVAAALAGAASEHGRLGMLVIDAAGLYGAAPQDGLEPLRAAADAAWVAASAAATAVMIAGGGGKLVVIAPAPGAGPHAGAARAALENLARTLSIEWARHQIRITTIHPGQATSPDEVGALVAYLASPAGDYYSGCLFTLGSTSG
jgi:NAD(P)-dependent dehydrogenase (short-subunit alcohol dehydrogenase family)